MEKIIQDDIEKLLFPDNIRTRPGTYVGSLENASICLREIIDNSLDESYKGTAKNIYIYNKNGKGIVIDDGRSIPIKKMTEKIWSTTFNEAIEVTMAYSSLFDTHAGSKFNKTTAQLGMNGLGSKAVNALSTEYILIVRCDENKVSESTERVKDLWNSIDKSERVFYMLKSEKGILKSESLIKYSEIFNIIPELNKEIIDNINVGTIVSFIPDPEIWESTAIKNPDTLRFFKYISSKVYNKETAVFINDKKYEESFSPYKYESIATLYSQIPDSKNETAQCLFSFNFDPDFGYSSTIGSINGLIVNSGHHIGLMTDAFRQAFNRVFPNHDYRGNETRGINFACIMICAEPAFNSQTKTHCSGIPGINYNCTEPLIDRIMEVIQSDYDKFYEHQQRVIEYNNLTQNLSRIEYIKSKTPILSEMGEREIQKRMPIKLKDCNSPNREECELFIVEGDSAGGSILGARDVNTQAMICLRGKPKNSAPLPIEEILENQEISDIISAIGTGIDEYFSLDKIRYGKIIIASDADADGANITSLIEGLFFAHMRYLIDAGMVYICDAPLYKQGDQYYYYGEDDKLDKSKPVKRFKGLGECGVDEIKDMMCNENTRRLVRVTKEGIPEALRLITNTYARKQLMIKNGTLIEDEGLSLKDLNIGE